MCGDYDWYQLQVNRNTDSMNATPHASLWDRAAPGLVLMLLRRFSPSVLQA